MIDSLRISITQKCNLKCPYCHKEGQLDSEKELSLEEIKRIAKVANEIGIRKIKITGGEPFLRNDIVDIVKIIKNNDFKTKSY